MSPNAFVAPGIGALLVIATTGFVGFESSVVFSEESRDPRRTVPVATFMSVVIIAILYALSSWAMTVAAGPSKMFLAVSNFATLLGVDKTSPLRWILPGAYIIAAAFGFVWGLILRTAGPETYTKIGLGAKAADLLGQARPAPESLSPVPNDRQRRKR